MCYLNAFYLLHLSISLNSLNLIIIMAEHQKVFNKICAVFVGGQKYFYR